MTDANRDYIYTVDNLQFFQSLSHTVACLSEQPHAECMAYLEQSFARELGILCEAKDFQSEQIVLGHVMYLTSLWRFFEVNAPQGEEAVESFNDPSNAAMLIDLLFPEAEVFTESRDTGFNVQAAEDLDTALPALCKSQEARKAVYKLLHEFVSHSTEMMNVCLHRFLEMLEPGPQSHAVLKQQYTEHLLRNSTEDLSSSMPAGRGERGWRGLQNGGATCYMNAIFQQLYMQPTIRALVLRGQVPDGREAQEESVFFQIQRMFAHLVLSNARSFTPSGIWNSMKDVEGQPINVMVRSLFCLPAGTCDCDCGAACKCRSVLRHDLSVLMHARRTCAWHSCLHS